MLRRMFVQLPTFMRLVWSGRLDDEGLRQLEKDILNGGGVTMPGTGGFKKIRLAMPGQGKSGGWRVIFADYPRLSVVVLVGAFAKSDQPDLTEAQRNALRQRRRLLDAEMERKYG